MSDAPAEAGPPTRRQLVIAGALLIATCISTTAVGAGFSPASLAEGLRYAVPLMAILLAHELGHYVAARIHGVPASLPYFVPMPLPPLGTMGAVILMRSRIRSRNALLDVGASGPLAGMAVALPVLIYGIAESPVRALPTDRPYDLEGHSIVYVALLQLLKGPFPPGHDILLSPTAFAGWVGLLVTMINLIPSRQLDGGHVAYALLGERFDAVSRGVRRGLLPLAFGVGAYYGFVAYLDGARGAALWGASQPGVQWLLWWMLLTLLPNADAREHPPTDPGELSPGRRVVALATLVLFVLVFMPAWLRTVVPPGP